MSLRIPARGAAPVAAAAASGLVPPGKAAGTATGGAGAGGVRVARAGGQVAPHAGLRPVRFALQGQRACSAKDAAAGGVAEPAVRHGASTLQKSTGFRRGRDGGAATDPGRALPSGRPRPVIP